jgi:hypothetical protein
MCYKTILVHFKDKRRIKRLFKAAAEIADRFQAYLLRLSVSPRVLTIPAGMPGTPDTIVIDDRFQAYREDNRQLRDGFFEAAAERRKVVPEWRECDAGQSTVVDIVTNYARNSDLLVASQSDAGSAHLDVVSAVTIASGRPTLLVPNEGPQAEIGRRIVVAWNASREAARAVFDAVPLLQKAEVVDVFTMRSSSEVGASYARRWSATKSSAKHSRASGQIRTLDTAYPNDAWSVVPTFLSWAAMVISGCESSFLAAPPNINSTICAFP